MEFDKVTKIESYKKEIDSDRALIINELAKHNCHDVAILISEYAQYEKKSGNCKIYDAPTHDYVNIEYYGYELFGKKYGKWIYWHTNGNKEKEIIYKDNKHHEYTWLNNGNKYKETEYENNNITKKYQYLYPKDLRSYKINISFPIKIQYEHIYDIKVGDIVLLSDPQPNNYSLNIGTLPCKIIELKRTSYGKVPHTKYHLFGIDVRTKNTIHNSYKRSATLIILEIFENSCFLKEIEIDEKTKIITYYNNDTYETLPFSGDDKTWNKLCQLYQQTSKFESLISFTILACIGVNTIVGFHID